MTQLFDTANYDSSDLTAADPTTEVGTRRHLRSIPAGSSEPDAITPNESTQWQLDQATIAAGRRGIALARQTLQDAAAASSSAKGSSQSDESAPKRRAA